jgi:cellulose synthase/poly-beta-1,6-N-acetylglucosamine synthase-like glycosyltransferase
MTPLDVIRVILEYSEYGVAAYFVGVNTFYLVLLVAAAFSLYRYRVRSWQRRHWRLLGSDRAPRLSVIAPAYNEKATIKGSVRALLTLRYPNLEVVIVNDGSTDDTLEMLEQEFELHAIHPDPEPLVDHAPIRGFYRSGRIDQLLVVDKVNGGKADAMNAGLNAASGELVCYIDADTLIEPDALLRLVQPYIERDDVIACGGTIRIGNGSVVRGGRVTERRAPRRFIPGVQVIEYVRAFLFGRLGWNSLGGNLVISGAFGLFRRDAVAAVGGLLHETVGEDMELIVRLRRRAAETGGPGHVVFVPDPVAWTEVPERLRDLARQRDRWQRGLSDTMWRHRRVFFNPRYRALGLIAYPYFLLVELLAPLVEAFGLLALPVALLLDAVNVEFALMLLLLAYGYGMLLTICSMLLEELSGLAYPRFRDRLRLLPWIFLETFGYRQMTVVWRLRGFWNYLRKRTEWGEMRRTGFAGEPAGAGGGTG